jgi:hypothetical protein
MSDRPTPETDNQIFEAWDDEGHYTAWVVDADFARRLECQRDEAQDAALEMQKAETESLCRLAGMTAHPEPKDPTKAADWWKPETDQ